MATICRYDQVDLFFHVEIIDDVSYDFKLMSFFMVFLVINRKPKSWAVSRLYWTLILMLILCLWVSSRT